MPARTAFQLTRSPLCTDQVKRLLSRIGDGRPASDTLEYGYCIAADEIEIGGNCDARFSAVRDALRENTATRGELGAAVCVAIDGRLVVELWCGWADTEHSRPWREDTLVNVFSVGKAIAALCLLTLVSRGQVALDAPVARYWPEFAAAGKDAVTVRMVLSHTAGLPAIARELPVGALYDWELVTSALAAQEPWWTPGAGHGYHVHTFGFLVGELVRRVSGESIGSFLRRELAGTLGVDLSFGLAAAQRARRAEFTFEAASAGAAERVAKGEDGQRALRKRAYLNPPGATGIGTVNTPGWQDAELPSANLHAGARDVVRVYTELVREEPSIIDRGLLREARTEAAGGDDLVLARPSRFGLGFQLTQPERPLGPNAASFGHFGAGGSLGFGDPEAGLAFAYVMNRGGPQWQDPRNRALIDAVYGAL
jgi:CubicO group peptidase (beta-lactamase class C family)